MLHCMICSEVVHKLCMRFQTILKFQAINKMFREIKYEFETGLSVLEFYLLILKCREAHEMVQEIKCFLEAGLPGLKRG